MTAMASVRIYAHRGAAVELPENTMGAFVRALEHGADALEMDVHMTKDGHLVVSHDPTGKRMCGVDARIRDCRLDEVKSWDAGRNFTSDDGARPFAGEGFTIPTFDEVLSELGDIVINVDLKQTRPSILAAFIDRVRSHGAEERVIGASFALANTVGLRRAGYAGPTALARSEVVALLAAPRSLYARLPWRGDAAQLPPRVGPLDLSSPRLIAKCQALGMRVDYWTINDPAEARRLLDAGADGIMTDDPERLVPAIRRWRAERQAAEARR
jgi:glycerophosphoryl diester phosphodiesterase